MNASKKLAIERYKQTDIKYGILIENMINEGYHLSPILSATLLNHKYFKSYLRWKDESLLIQLQKNMKEKKKKKLTKHQTEAVERYKKTDEKFGKQIEKMINDGYHMAPILTKTGIKQTYFTRYFKWKDDNDLINKLRKNSREIILKNALKNSIRGANKTKGRELKIITKEVENFYKKLLDEGRHLSYIKKEMKKKGYGSLKVKQMVERYGKPDVYSFSRKNNPMYGKTPDSSAGIGTKGWCLWANKKIFFRSSLEMKIFFYLNDNNIRFELADDRIPYSMKGENRTYCPDFVIGDTLYEIKPSALLSLKENKIKFEYAREYCREHKKNFVIITENTYPLEKYNKKYIDAAIKEGKLILDEENYQKLMRNI